MSTPSPLSKQKHRLAALFSLSIFSIIVLLDLGFLSYKYFDYRKQEWARLLFQVQGIAKLINEAPLIKENLLGGKSLPMPFGGMHRNNDTGPGGERRWGRGRLQMENFFLYDSRDGKILYSPQKDDELYGSILSEVKSETEDHETSFVLGETEYLFLNVPVSPELGIVVFSESRMTDASLLQDVLVYLLGAVLLSLLVYAISYRFADSTLSPVEASMEQMEQFVHNAGHELKTPIAVVKSSLELMLLSKKYKEGIEESLDELDRMDGLIEALLRLSTMENPGSSESLDIRGIFEKIEKNYREKLDAKGISMEIVSKKTSQVRANRECTEMLFGNIVSNAIKYNKEGGSIVVAIDQKGVSVRDTGIGIAKENLPKVFDRFYREDGTRTTGSFGIGLSLVQRIASFYGWTVSLESEKWEGTTVKVEF